MPDLRTLGPRLEEDLDQLAAEVGLPRRTLERARAFAGLAGPAGLQCLGPLRPTPALEAFHRQQVEKWLARELPGRALQVHARRNRYTLEVEGRQDLQLRFVPDSCRWFLLVRRQGSWWPHLPSRPCLSLTDWLGQVRQLLTLGHKAR